MEALQVARYFITLNNLECKEEAADLSKLKIQKLLYYAQGYYLALFNKPLFEENIEAWDHGPVVREVYDQFKQHEGIYVPTNAYRMNEAEQECIETDKRELIEEVFCLMGQYSAWKLRDKTHNEEPWLNSYETGKNNIISIAAIQSYFKHYVNGQD